MLFDWYSGASFTYNKYGHSVTVLMFHFLQFYIFFNDMREAREFGPDGFVDIEEL